MLRTFALASRVQSVLVSRRTFSVVTGSTTIKGEGESAAVQVEGAEGNSAHAVDNQLGSENVTAEESKKTRSRVPEYIKPWQKKWFPNERILLVKPEELDVTCTELVFRVPPHMTKHEIKDYLQTIYGFDVKKVNTVNRLGKVKYPAGFSLVKHKSYRRPDFKQAYVSLNSPDMVQQPSNQIVRNVPVETSQNKANPE